MVVASLEHKDALYGGALLSLTLRFTLASGCAALRRVAHVSSTVTFTFPHLILLIYRQFLTMSAP